MTQGFKAKPPLPVWKCSGGGGIKKYIYRLYSEFGSILLQAVTPFNSRPEQPADPPEPDTELSDEQLEFCQKLFDQTESRRTSLEQKAQWTFASIVFLVPLLASIFVFLSKNAPHGISRIVAAAFLVISGTLLFLGFISVIRAVSVQSREVLFLDALIDPETSQFRTYSKSFHGRGLIYCTSVNTAMNDHIAQFVKGAHILTASAVVMLLLAAVPASIEFSSYKTPPSKTSIVGSVTVNSSEFEGLSSQKETIQDGIAQLNKLTVAQDQTKALQAQVDKLEAELQVIEQTISRDPKLTRVDCHRPHYAGL